MPKTSKLPTHHHQKNKNKQTKNPTPKLSNTVQNLREGQIYYTDHKSGHITIILLNTV